MIDKPVEGVTTVTRPHPAGAKGAHMSLDEVAERAWNARMSPRLRAWAIQQLENCGRPKSRREQGQCILDAFRKKVPYVADPVMGEFMASPNQILCLDEGGLCVVGGDCDEAAITLAAAMMSIGVPAMIIGSSHRPPHDVPTHVYMGFEDEFGELLRMDGTTKFPVGKVSPREREWWVEPGKKAKESGEGNFVGMADGKSGDLSGPPALLDLIFPGIR